jgi:hypothetical protein
MLAGVAALMMWCGGTLAQTGAAPACETSKVTAAPPGGVETPAERIARLDRALEESLAQHDECLLALSSAGGSASGSGGSGGESGGGSGAEGDGRRDAAGQGEGDQSDGETTMASTAASDADARDLDTSGPPVTGSALDNGAIPPDIPSGLDDDIVAQQIREAAQAETDPELRARLWDDYRKYTGLPPA